ncbi:unnamed protein product [Ectocarpus sp. CCAP 1310/34]|nr:unnamed protein product [Ectocarpus sp. CCAP 1310/34]
MLKKSMSARDIVGQVNDTLGEEFNLRASRCIGFMLDGCAANLLALDSLTQHIYRKSVGIPCFSHLFNNIGTRLRFPDVDEFLGKLHTLLSHSPQAKALFREIVGVTDPPTPNHRWGSRYERDYLIAMNWPGVVKFIEAYKSNDDEKSKTATWLRSELARKRNDGKDQVLVLRMQLAVLVDVGKIVTAACIFLEGDEPLLHQAFSKIEKFRSQLELGNDGLFKEDVALPTLDAVIAAGIGQGDDFGATADLLKAEFQDELVPLRTYAYDQIGPHEDAERATVLKYMEAARLIDFTFMRRHKYSANEVRSLAVFPFTSEEQVDKFLTEKDYYYVAARVTDRDYDFWQFWQDHKEKLPTWFAVVLDIALVQPSSAFVERVSSTVRSCLVSSQNSCLSDRIMAAALIKYNRGRDRHSLKLRYDKEELAEEKEGEAEGEEEEGDGEEEEEEEEEEGPGSGGASAEAGVVDVDMSDGQ